MKKEQYDVIIIGAGISGLVCGCYLAKSGLKVLMLEQHDKPGGYCTSFDRNGYIFDVAVHYLGSCRKGKGILYNIFKELDILDEIDLMREEKANRIITSDKEIILSSSIDNAFNDFVENFPQEKENLVKFFNLVNSDDPTSFISKTKSLTLEQLLNNFFKNRSLVSFFSILAGNLGLLPSEVSALTAIVLYREYIFDGGYYPKGGIQQLPDLLARKFREYGGTINLSTRVDSINVKNKNVTGITLKNNEIMISKIVVSNADATSTFENLLKCKSPEQRKIHKLRISPSAVILYLGVKKNLKMFENRSLVTWFFLSDVKKCYDTSQRYDPKFLFRNKDSISIDYIICNFPSLLDNSIAPKGKSIIKLMCWVRATDGPWEANKIALSEKLISLLNKLIPGVNTNIEINEIATPPILEKYTSNNNGAAFGWAALPDQIDRNTFSYNSSFGNLYLTGHWVTMGTGQSGIAQVAFCGKKVAKAILDKFN